MTTEIQALQADIETIGADLIKRRNARAGRKPTDEELLVDDELKERRGQLKARIKAMRAAAAPPPPPPRPLHVIEAEIAELRGRRDAITEKIQGVKAERERARAIAELDAMPAERRAHIIRLAGAIGRGEVGKPGQK